MTPPLSSFSPIHEFPLRKHRPFLAHASGEPLHVPAPCTPSMGQHRNPGARPTAFSQKSTGGRLHSGTLKHRENCYFDTTSGTLSACDFGSQSSALPVSPNLRAPCPQSCYCAVLCITDSGSGGNAATWRRSALAQLAPALSVRSQALSPRASSQPQPHRFTPQMLVQAMVAEKEDV